jgi:TPP-dependent pyruvate/acetoin dehydrogenase alpha subunit
MITKEELIEFEEEIAKLFLDKKIRAPIHLSKGNEDELIKFFLQTNIDKGDWIFSTHRSHYHALLKGIPREWVRAEILKGRSMHLFNKEYNFFSSSIVGGCLPIALGTALAIKRKGEDRWVYCFVGDMAAETGSFNECWKYATGWDLPITFVVEDNGFSTDTPTQKVWGELHSHTLIKRYQYKREYPHVGVGEWVTF